MEYCPFCGHEGHSSSWHSDREVLEALTPERLRCMAAELPRESRTRGVLYDAAWVMEQKTNAG
jgi:hypothetical protein